VNSLEGYQEVDSYWYDQVPSYWKKTKNKYVFCQNKHVVGDDWEKFTLLTMGKSGVKPRDMDGRGKFPASFENYQTVEPDQLIFCLFDLDETPRTIGMSKDYGMITSAYDVFSTTEGNNSQFWTYFYQMIDDHKGLRPFYTGLRKVVRSETFMGIGVFSPPLEEQKLISRYLDKKTEQIDRLVEKIQKEIELLKEQRTSLINQCVTKGLDPNVEMKDSGIEWIGEIPKHWKIKKLKHIVNKRGLIRGPFGSSLKVDIFVPKGYKVYEQKNAIYNNFSLGTSYINNKKYTELKRFSIREHDILMSCSGTIGKTSLVQGVFEEGIINQALLIIRLEVPENTLPKYIRTVFSSSFFQEQVIDNSQGGAMKNLVGIDIFKNVKIPIPDPLEQKEILKYLDNKYLILDKLISQEKLRVERFKEYRQSLISSVVTGKVRVTEDMI
jgi:type I restriction enzyme, S subunit